MADKFEIGEVAIYVRPGSRHYGEDVTVVGCLKERRVVSDKVDQSSIGIIANDYQVTFSDGSIRGALPEWLRKKKPPRREIDQVTTWDECLWKPREIEKYAQNNN